VHTRVRARLIAAAGLVVVVGVGMRLAGSAERASRRTIERLRTQEVAPEQAQTAALARDLNFTRAEGYFHAQLEADARAFGVEPSSLEVLKRPNPFFDEIDTPVVVAPGKLWRSPHIELRVSIEKVTYRQRGAAVTANHSVAYVTNTSRKPLAYLLRLRSAERGECPARGARTHNAMSLAPGQRAQVVVCAGMGSVQIDELRVLEVTPIGAVYVSKVPPVAVGHDAVTSGAHRGLADAPLCTKVPGVTLAQRIRAGVLSWEDVADYYSRHNCERDQIGLDYRLETSPVVHLPVASAEERAPG